jgi:hypothetical protein
LKHGDAGEGNNSTFFPSVVVQIKSINICKGVRLAQNMRESQLLLLLFAYKHINPTGVLTALPSNSAKENRNANMERSNFDYFFILHIFKYNSKRKY